MPVTFRRGFKREANDLARSVRRDLGVALHAPVDPWQLANFLDIPVLPLSELRGAAPAAVHHFHRVEPSTFSAVTVFRGRRRAVVHNDQHSRGRQANDVVHELSHALLGHEPMPALDIVGCRDWDPVLEKEADWQGAAILISEEAALHIVRYGLSFSEAADYYGCSEALVRMRVNVTGALRRAA